MSKEVERKASFRKASPVAFAYIAQELGKRLETIRPKAEGYLGFVRYRDINDNDQKVANDVSSLLGAAHPVPLDSVALLRKSMFGALIDPAAPKKEKASPATEVSQLRARIVALENQFEEFLATQSEFRENICKHLSTMAQKYAPLNDLLPADSQHIESPLPGSLSSGGR